MSGARYDWSEVDWTESNYRIAKRLGCSESSVFAYRRRKQMPAPVIIKKERVQLTKGNIHSFVNVTSAGCWEWKGAKGNKGYGSFQSRSVHRMVYEMFVGSIPAGLLVRHTCDNPPCCNPRHLVVGTHLDNARDRVTRGRGYCGDRHGRSILRSEDVTEIRRRRAAGERVPRISRDFPQVSQSAVWSAALGHSWKHLPESAA